MSECAATDRQRFPLWISGYCYRACEVPSRPASFAFAYLDRVGGELARRIMACPSTTWNYAGPALTK